MTFFNSEMYPSYETTKMSIGECFNMIKGGDLTVPSYQREYVWTKKEQGKYLYSISKGIPLFGPVVNIISATGDQFIMDGQNRLMTIYKFMNDDVTLTNDDDESITSNISDDCSDIIPVDENIKQYLMKGDNCVL